MNSYQAQALVSVTNCINGLESSFVGLDVSVFLDRTAFLRTAFPSLNPSSFEATKTALSLNVYFQSIRPILTNEEYIDEDDEDDDETVPIGYEEYLFAFTEQLHQLIINLSDDPEPTPELVDLSASLQDLLGETWFQLVLLPQWWLTNRLSTVNVAAIDTLYQLFSLLTNIRYKLISLQGSV